MVPQCDCEFTLSMHTYNLSYFVSTFKYWLCNSDGDGRVCQKP